MNFKTLMLITILTSTQMVYAESHLLILGGGGDPTGHNTIFDQDLINLSQNLEKSKWKYDISFNGGHKYTEGIIKKKFAKSQSPASGFTVLSYMNLIESYKLKIKNNEIKSGDQIMILINSHGAKRKGNQISHYIAAENVYVETGGIDGKDKANLDMLQELITLTNKNGIKLGIVDLSCNSGTTLALKKNAPNTCIIAATSSEHYSYNSPGSFTDNFIKGLKPGLSLENIFLKARLETKDSSYPLISTNENDIIMKETYPAIAPYLFYQSSVSDRLTPYILENGTTSQFCKRESNFKTLISQINGLKSILDSRYSSFNADELIGLLRQYKKMQDNVIKTSIKLGASKLDTIEKFSPPPGATSDTLLEIKFNYTWRELLNFDIPKSIFQYQRYLLMASKENTKKEYQSIINYLETVEKRKEQLMTENPFLQTYEKQMNLLVNQMSNTQDIAQKIAKQERILYDELYGKNQTNNLKDPCKQIVF